ncbi:MAG: hypothetical protein K0Q49_2125 [Haloplasmataceae bacterium]|jgi:hypothetical protein|nr:hypothetical protein [Haloplasmataceae bacterium]
METLDTSIVTTLVGVAKSCLGLVTEFPLNIFLVTGLVGVAFGIIRKVKGVAR